MSIYRRALREFECHAQPHCIRQSLVQGTVNLHTFLSF
jgi:hypothetical protein